MSTSMLWSVCCLNKVCVLNQSVIVLLQEHITEGVGASNYHVVLHTGQTPLHILYTEQGLTIMAARGNL